MNKDNFFPINQLLIYTLTIVLLCFLACDSSHPSPAKSKSHDELKVLLQKYYKTMSARDWPAYQTFFSADATLTTIWQSATDTIPKINTSSISEFIAQTKDGPDSQPIFEEKMTNAEITVRNNLAQAWVNYEAKFGTEEELMEWKGVDLFSFIKYQNEWKIVSITFESE